MKVSIPVAVLLLLALANCGLASTLEDLLGFDCIEKGGECNTINKPCCGEDVCYFPGGYNIRTARKGECVTCVENNLKCQRDNQCCQTDSIIKVQCQKDHPFHMNGVCVTLFGEGTKCYKDSQCANDNCDKPRFWHMYGRCGGEGNNELETET